MTRRKLFFPIKISITWRMTSPIPTFPTEHTHLAENAINADEVVIKYEDPREGPGQVKRAALQSDPKLTMPSPEDAVKSASRAR